MQVCVKSALVRGVQSEPVTIEIEVISGSGFTVNGLTKEQARETTLRVNEALKSTGLSLPKRKTVVNVLGNSGGFTGGLDLGIALGMLAGYGIIESKHLDEALVVGELSLNGDCRSSPGALAHAKLADERGYELIVASANADEANFYPSARVIGMESLVDAVQQLNGSGPELWSRRWSTEQKLGVDMSDVLGLGLAKRALEISAAGGHNMLIVGNPGSGKTMLARRLPTIMPEMIIEEMLETTTCFSVVGLTSNQRPVISERPFRAPHHTVSSAGLLGGGPRMMPGEVSLVHNGVLFLDEVTEFRRFNLESLSIVVEAGEVRSYRKAGLCRMPASFTLVASMQPCPCGGRDCSCSKKMIERHNRLLPAKLRRMIDLKVSVQRSSNGDSGDNSESIRGRVEAARQRQLERSGKLNARLDFGETLKHCGVSSVVRKQVDGLVTNAVDLGRLLRVARTVADLSGEEAIQTSHLEEALSFFHF